MIYFLNNFDKYTLINCFSIIYKYFTQDNPFHFQDVLFFVISIFLIILIFYSIKKSYYFD